MAAYKRPPTVPVRKKATERVPHQKHHRIFSLHSVRIKIHKTQKNSRTWRTIPQTLTFSRTKFKQIQAQCSGIHHGSQRFINESSSPNHFLCNSSMNPPLKAANSRDHKRRRIEKKKERNSKDLNRRRRRRRDYRFISGSKPRINKTESKSKVCEDSSSNLRLKHR